MSYKLKICPKCSAENFDSEKNCLVCKSSLASAKDVVFGDYSKAYNSAPADKRSFGKSLKSFLGNLILSMMLASVFLTICLITLHYPNAKDSADKITIIWQGNFTRIVYVFGILTAAYWAAAGKKSRYRKSAIFMTLYWLIGGGLAVLINSSATNSISAPPAAITKPTQTYNIPAQVLPLIDGVGINHSLIQKVNIQIPNDSSACSHADTSEAAACFSPPSTIFYPQTEFMQTAIDQRESFSHEYLHYIWSTTPKADKDRLTPLIEQAYQSSKPYMDTRLKSYIFKAPEQRVDELHSYIGTEIADTLIPVSLLDHYKQYLPNRNALPSYYPYPIQRNEPPVYYPSVYVPLPYSPPPKVCHDYGFDIYDFTLHETVHHPNVLCL